MNRIMVVDDEKYIREWYSLEFSQMGYETSATGTCNKLVKKIDMFQPDLVIMDIRLVDCDGLEMLQEIRNANPDLAIIICSAYDSYRNDIKTLAADYYVVKSFDLAELKEKVQRTFEARIPFLTRAV